ncbi:MAG TPA: hypothetical protein VHA75_00820, partial [Rugosimonospora sp.]|nr:hypothetical protein [Rugosimonospora sp.]
DPHLSRVSARDSHPGWVALKGRRLAGWVCRVRAHHPLTVKELAPMTTIVPTITYLTTIVVTAASGDGATVAGLFNGKIVSEVSVTAAATATNHGGVVTITWPATQVSCGDDLVQNFVTNLVSNVSSLTSPVLVSAATTVGEIV